MMRRRRLMLFAVLAGALLAVIGQAYDVLDSAGDLLAGIEFDGDDPLEES